MPPPLLFCTFPPLITTNVTASFALFAFCAQTSLLSVDLQALGQSLAELPLPALLGVDSSYCLQIVSNSRAATWDVDVVHEVSGSCDLMGHIQ